MSNVVRMDPDTYAAIHGHLLSATLEAVAFALAGVTQTDAGVRFDVQDTELMRSVDLDAQSRYHVALTDEAQGRVIKKAWDWRLALVEFHAHGMSRRPAAFSPTDWSGFAEWVPHVWWRLKAVPYAAVVLTPKDFDALVWRTDPHTPEPLRKLEIGRQVRRPSNATIALLEDNSGRRAVP